MAEKRVSGRGRHDQDLRREFTHGNLRSVRNYGGVVIGKAMSAVALGRDMVLKMEEAEHIDGLRISPLGG